MVFVKVLSLHINVLRAELIHIEVDVSRGLNHFSIVGLAGKAIDEAKERMSVAIKNCGFVSPLSRNHKTIISLAPADIKKEGPHFDLALALAYLLSVDDISFNPAGKVFVGELALDGTLRSVKMILAFVVGAKREGVKEIYIPHTNVSEVNFISGITIYPVKHLRDIIDHLNTKKIKVDAGISIKNIDGEVIQMEVVPYVATQSEKDVDFVDIKGQEHAKRALEISACGRHNIMLYGPPGTGKTMLAKSFSYLLPPLTLEESIEVTSIHNSHGVSGVVSRPPFRSPHHSSTLISLIGGGAVPRAGEITLAHRGVLFADELPEYNRQVIDSLRQPLEDGVIHIARARGHITFPADFILIASMNSCPCGYFGSTKKSCVCSDATVSRYQKKISGPIVDRIDMWVAVTEVEYEKLQSSQTLESSSVVKERIAQSYQKPIGSLILSTECAELLKYSAEQLKLSARAYNRVIKVSRSIANMEDSIDIKSQHILEALQYRPKF